MPTLVDVLRRRAAEEPDRTALIFVRDHGRTEDRLGYGELDLRARAIAARLQDQCRPGDRAVVCHPPGLDYAAAFFGCLYAGVLAVPAYPPRSEPMRLRLEAIIGDASPRFLLGVAAQERELQRDLSDPDLHVIGTDSIPDADARGWVPVDLDERALAFLQYTSGSTGRPRGVMVGHGNLMHNLAAILDGLGQTRESLSVTWLPPYHDMGLIGGLLAPVFGGFPVRLMRPESFLQRPRKWLEEISLSRATTSGAPNFAYDLCVERIGPAERASLDLRSWTTAFCGAEPVRAATLRRFAEAFAPSGFRPAAYFPCYGLAEATLMVSGRHVGAGRVAAADDAVSCGRTRPDARTVVVDPETRSLLAEGATGEIWVAGPSVAAGYWSRAEETERTFRARLASGDPQPFLRTGDLGHLAAGELYVTGRLKDVVVVDGVKHHAEDLERTAAGSHPALHGRAGAAFAVELDGGERLVIAHEVRARHADGLDLDDVLACMRRSVAARHRVAVHAVALVRAGALPRTTSGKVRRSACRERFLAADLGALREWRLRPSADDRPAAARS